ncbi:hypothetical protein GWC95_16730 [Sediminibacterium roseum]|uniref:Glycosyl transferase family 2 n=1 Tax=Sediminibacterium roseum TaxID=1978412 RepID=A0ABW9ZZ33_9BACT|nr:hypothetical protein [Sediminibacterium roseum]NCI51577.1 hypothetical protein [Sediminibacterium roseum]
MSTAQNNVALLVHSCDRYELLYKGFSFFFSKYWDFSARCNYYFATEEKTVSIDHFENIRSGKGQWADRLVVLLNSIPEKYVLYFQEDMWLNKKVNGDFFNRLFEMAEANDWKLVKLHSSEVYTTVATGIFIEGFEIAKLDNQSSDFLMSHQVTLWNKEFLIRQLHRNEHPWRNERKGTARLKKLNPEIFQADYFAENGKPPVNRNDNPVLRSEYQTVSMNSTLSGNVAPYINELLHGDSNDRQYAMKLQHNYNNQLTHDGLQPARKVDVFKQAKTWVKKAFGK